jgi:hypothetical protein
MVGARRIVNAGREGERQDGAVAAINGFDPAHQFFALAAAQQGF